MKVALAQMKIDSRLSLWQEDPISYREKLEENALELIKKASKAKSSLIVFPELFNCPYFPASKARLSGWQTFATESNGPIVKKFTKIARALKIAIVLPIFEKDGKKYFNSCVVINKAGRIVGVYRKAILPNNVNAWEKNWFSAGACEPFVFKLEGFRIGIIVCFERYFPELVRKTALKGADLIVAPSAASGSSEVSWESIAVAHAVQNQIYYLAVNRLGYDLYGARQFYGNTLGVCPFGRIRHNAGKNINRNLYAKLEKIELTKIRNALPLLVHVSPV